MRIFEIIESIENDVYKELNDDIKEFSSNFKFDINAAVNSSIDITNMLLNNQGGSMVSEFLKDIQNNEETVDWLKEMCKKLPDQTDPDVIEKLNQCIRAKQVIQKMKQKLKDAGLMP